MKKYVIGVCLIFSNVVFCQEVDVNMIEFYVVDTDHTAVANVVDTINILEPKYYEVIFNIDSLIEDGEERDTLSYEYLTTPDEDDLNMLMRASKEGGLELVNYFISKYYNIKIRDCEELLGKDNTLENKKCAALETANYINLQNEEDFTALITAADNNRLDVVKTLLNRYVWFRAMSDGSRWPEFKKDICEEDIEYRKLFNPYIKEITSIRKNDLTAEDYAAEKVYGEVVAYLNSCVYVERRASVIRQGSKELSH